MSKFNSKTKTPKVAVNKKLTTGKKVVNRAGGGAYDLTQELKLISILATSFLGDGSYRSGSQTASELKQIVKTLCDRGQAEFVAKAAIYARTKFNMRSVSHIVAGELVEEGKGVDGIRGFFTKIVERPDDMLEILSYYENIANKRDNGKIKLPASIKNGFKSAFDKFNDYQIAKYKNEGKEWSLIDVVNLVRPVPTEKNQVSLKQLVDGVLKNENTFESVISAAGQDSNSEEETNAKKAEGWTSLIMDGSIGYMALVKNLRNISESVKDQKVIKKACELLCDKKRILNSKMLPFRYYVAYQMLEKAYSSSSGYNSYYNSSTPDAITLKNYKTFMDGLSDALDISVDNCPKLDGSTLVVLDESGSMSSPINDKSFGGLSAFEAGLFFSIILYKSSDDVDFMTFNDNAYYKLLNKKDSIMTNLKSYNFKPAGTDFRPIFRTANRAYDRVIILSDMQGWHQGPDDVPTVEPYKKKYNVDPKIINFDLTGLGTVQFIGKNVSLVAGFSQEVFNLIQFIETNPNAIIDEINSISLVD